VAFLLIHALAIVAWFMLFATSSFVISQFGGAYNMPVTPDDWITFGLVISFNLAFWPVLAALMWLYSGRPRSFWANMLDY
jgi:hypothetical protein